MNATTSILPCLALFASAFADDQVLFTHKGKCVAGAATSPKGIWAYAYYIDGPRLSYAVIGGPSKAPSLTRLHSRPDPAGD